MGGWSATTWTTVANNGYYRLSLEWAYRQDTDANKTQFWVGRLGCTNINKLYGYNCSVAVGLTSIGNIYNYKNTTQTFNLNIAGTTANQWVYYDTGGIYQEVTHNDDGTIPTQTGQFKWKCSINSNHTPQWDWTNFTISGIPAIPVGPKIRYKVDGTWKKVKAYIKVDGAWKKINKLYYKKNGSFIK